MGLFNIFKKSKTNNLEKIDQKIDDLIDSLNRIGIKESTKLYSIKSNLDNRFENLKPDVIENVQNIILDIERNLSKAKSMYISKKINELDILISENKIIVKTKSEIEGEKLDENIQHSYDEIVNLNNKIEKLRIQLEKYEYERSIYQENIDNSIETGDRLTFNMYKGKLDGVTTRINSINNEIRLYKNKLKALEQLIRMNENVKYSKENAEILSNSAKDLHQLSNSYAEYLDVDTAKIHSQIINEESESLNQKFQEISTIMDSTFNNSVEDTMLDDEFDRAVELNKMKKLEKSTESSNLSKTERE